MKTTLKMFQQVWIINTNYYYHKLPTYIEESGEKRLEYREIQPMYVCSIIHWWNKNTVAEMCPIDFSKKENKNASWCWKRPVEDKDLGDNVFLSREEAEKKYSEYPKELRNKWREIKQLKRLSK